MSALDARGLFPVRIGAAKASGGTHWSRRISPRHMAAFYSQLADPLHSELPALTIMLMTVSHFLQRHGWWLVIVLGGALYMFRRWAAAEQGRLIVDNWRLHLPGAGRIYLNLALVRFTRILGTLLHNAIPI